jgi:hypothetical protein
MVNCINSNDLPYNADAEMCPKHTVNPRLKHGMSHTVRYMTDNNLRRLRSGVEDLLEPPSVQLGVCLRRGDGFVPQGDLDKPDVAGGIVKPSCKRVSQCVGRNRFIDSGLDRPSANNPLDLPSGEAMATGISEQWLSRVCPTVQRPKRSQDRLAHGNDFRVSAFGLMKGDRASVPVDVPDVERNCLTKPAASSQHEHQQTAITFGPLPFEREAQQGVDLITSQDDRRQSPVPLATQDGSRVALDQPPCFTPSEQGLQANPVAIDARLATLGSTGANLNAVAGHEAGHHRWRDRIDGGVAREPGERSKVSSVSCNRVGRPALSLQIIQKSFDGVKCAHGALRLFCSWFVATFHTGGTGGLYQVISDMVAIVYVSEYLAIGA